MVLKSKLCLYIRTINNIYKIAYNTDGKIIDLSKYDNILTYVDNLKKEDVVKCAKKVFKEYNKQINAETYIKILNNVRKIEYYNNPEKYPYGINVLNCIYKNSK